MLAPDEPASAAAAHPILTLLQCFRTLHRLLLPETLHRATYDLQRHHRAGLCWIREVVYRSDAVCYVAFW